MPFDDVADCSACFLAATNSEMNLAWGGDGVVLPVSVPTPASKKPKRTSLPLLPPCKWEGPIVSHCTTCGNKDGRHERLCGHPDGDRDKCTRGDTRSTLQRCNACPQYEREAPAKQSATARPAREWPVRSDLLPPLSRTFVDVPGFNPGMVEHRGTLWFAPRNHERLYLYALDAGTFQPQARTAPPLNLSHPLATNGHEDARLFVHGGELHAGFVGIKSGKKRHELRISQLYANLTTGEVVAPSFPGVQPVEKNWGWFEHDGELYAVYSISPHVVVRLRDGERFATANQLPWSGGYLRGGAPPVRVGDRYVCWFHGATEEKSGRVYNVGVYEFEAAPPFRVLRQSPAPLLWASGEDAVEDGSKRVVFPCGAVLRGGEWLVSSGSADAMCEVMRWRADDVSGVLA